jgi:hypothetical protein
MTSPTPRTHGADGTRLGNPASAEPCVNHDHSAGAGGQAGAGPLASENQDCSGDTCITCSDSAVTVTVLWLMGDDLAMVDTGTGQEVVSVGLVEAKAGDQLLVHAKEAIAVIGS